MPCESGALRATLLLHFCRRRGTALDALSSSDPSAFGTAEHDGVSISG